ncbi:MAG: hypothetical protein JRJ03_19400, partial [Deltaproteobacteria bacterium]|nr:hypothetical protein [Deltaproteobacteria bacterium]
MVSKKHLYSSHLRMFSLFIFLLIFAFLSVPLSFAGEDDKEKKDLPRRAIGMLPEYTGVILPEGEDLDLDIEVFNRGREDEIIKLSLVSVPE